MKGKDFTCSFDLLLAKKLLQRNLFDLDVNSTKDVWENTTNLKNDFISLVKMAKAENILPKPRLFFLFVLILDKTK